MPLPYVEAVADRFDYLTDFRQVVADEDPGSDHMSNDVQEATVYGFVSANKVRSAYKWFLGVATADTAAPWRLHRDNPMPHLEYPWLYAYDVSVVKKVPLANDTLNPLDENYLKPKTESPFEIPFFESDTFYFTRYDEALLAIRYRNFLQRFREDEEIEESTDEWRRHTWIQPTPRIEALTVTGGMSQLKFAETGAGGPTAATTPFGAPIACLLSKKGIVVTWYDVPWEYLSTDDDIFTPTKLDAIAGHVNTDLFLGRFEPGTMLAEPYTASVSTWAVPSSDTRDPLRKVTLQIPFTFFDPERGATAPVARGHNLMPWSGTGTTATGGGNGKFFLATRDGSLGGDRLIPGAVFGDIFTHVSAP